MVLKCPWPWFGGKSSVCDLLWSRLGDVDNYIAAFAGTIADVLRRPAWHRARVETLNDEDCLAANFWRATDPEHGRPGDVAAEVVNDADPMVANFWRAVQDDPDGTAAYADGPVNEADLHSRHRWLVLSDDAAAFRERMRTDPLYFDVRVAGWWAWGLCCWIGGGWCSTNAAGDDSFAPNRGPTMEQCAGGGKGVNGVGVQPQRRPNISGDNPGSYGKGVHATGPELKRPHLASPSGSSEGATAGKGVNSATWEQRPDIGGWNGDMGSRGVHSHLKQQLPLIEGHYGSSGRGVHAPRGDGRPQLADAYARGRGVHGNDAAGTCERRRAWLCDWFRKLRDRLRPVRVCCGHWRRVCDSESVTTRLGSVGLFLDPPYALDVGRMHAWVRHLLGEGPEPEAAGAASNRDGNLYANDRSQDVDRLVADVHVYCRERGALPGYRIALCGYAGEHDALEGLGWDVVAWRAQGGYGSRGKKGRANAGRERIWFSPGCLKPGADLFAGV